VIVAGRAPNRRYSVRRRSLSSPGRAARWAPRLFRGADRNAAVGHTRRAAVTRPPVPAAASEPMMPARPSAANSDSGRFPRTASHQRASSAVFGVRRNSASFANSPCTDARATTIDVDCQIMNAPSASRHDAPVPRRSRAIARTRPNRASSGIAASRKPLSLRKSRPPPSATLPAPTRRKRKNITARRSPYHWTAPDR
jgi:hypothetical protein